MGALCYILGLLSIKKWRILFNCKNFRKAFVCKCLAGGLARRWERRLPFATVAKATH
jgi:hypothetical protein